MCQIFAGQSPERYAYQTRSVRLGGHVTSIRLERAFWDTLAEIAAAQDMPLGQFLTTLHDEVLELRHDTHNFASLLRCACLTYAAEIRGDGQAVDALREEAARGAYEPPAAAAE